MRRILLGLLVVANLAAQQTYPTHWGEFSVPRHEGSYVNTVRPERFVTPHLPFAKPLFGGPVKVLFIANPPTARDIAELHQRLDLTFQAVLPASGVEMGWTHPIHTAVVGLTIPEKERELDDALDTRYDAICLLGIEFRALPPKTRFEILRQVQTGTGLLGTFGDCRERRIEHPLADGTTAADVLRDTPLQGLPYLATQAPDKWLTPARFGDGRIAWLNYGGAHHQRHWYTGDALGRPASPTPHSPWPTAEAYDAAMTVAARALLWVARRELPARLHPDLTDGTDVDFATWPGKVTGKLTRQDDGIRAATIDATFVRPSGTATATGRVTIQFAGATTPFAVDLPCPPHGTAWLFLVARDDAGAVLDFTCTSVQVHAPATIANAELVTDVVDPGGRLELRLAAPGHDATCITRANDVFGRCFHSTQGSGSVSIPVLNARGRSGHVVVHLMVDGKVADQRILPFSIRREYGHQFIRLMWAHPGIPDGTNGNEMGYLSLLRGRQLQAAGWNAGMVFANHNLPTESRALARANAGCFDYCAHIGEAHLRQFLRPDARAADLARLTARSTAARDFPPFAYSLGDENGYPRGPAALVMDAAAKDTFQTWLEREYGDVATLNEYWHTDFAAFSDVGPEVCQGRDVPVPRQVDLARFWDWAYAWAHAEKARAVRAGDPTAKVGAEGSLPGDLEQSIAGLDWWAPYYSRYVNSLLRFWMPEDSLRANWWGGYTMGRRGPDALWMQLATGSVNASFWFIGNVSMEGAFCPDLSLADHVESWEPEMRYVERHAGPLMKAARSVDDGMAIYWDRVSEHVNAADRRFGDTNTTQRELIRLCDGLGVNARFISRRDILAGKLDPARTRVLLMCVVKAIPDDLPAALERYVRAGGIVVADVAPDGRDERGREVAPGRLLPLFGVTSAGPEPRQVPVHVDTAELHLNAAKPCTVDASIKVAAGRARGAAGDVPLVIVRQVGKGHAILLNVPFYEALGLEERPDARTTPAGDLLLEILALGGVRPQFPPPPGMPWGSIRTFRLADATIVGLHDWQDDTHPPRYLAEAGRRLHVLRFPEPIDGIGSVDLPPGTENAILAVCPPAPRSLRLDTRRPEHVTAYLTVGGKPLAGSLLRLDVFAPDGQRLEAHEQYRLSDTEGTDFPVPMALNATPGTYRLHVTELLSGTTAEADREVHP